MAALSPHSQTIEALNYYSVDAYIKEEQEAQQLLRKERQNSKQSVHESIKRPMNIKSLINMSVLSHKKQQSSNIIFDSEASYIQELKRNSSLEHMNHVHSSPHIVIKMHDFFQGRDGSEANIQPRPNFFFNRRTSGGSTNSSDYQTLQKSQNTTRQIQSRNSKEHPYHNKGGKSERAEMNTGSLIWNNQQIQEKLQKQDTKKPPMLYQGIHSIGSGVNANDQFPKWFKYIDKKIEQIREKNNSSRKNIIESDRSPTHDLPLVKSKPIIIKKSSQTHQAYGKLKGLFSVSSKLNSSGANSPNNTTPPPAESQDYNNIFVYPQMEIEGSKVKMSNYLPSYYAPLAQNKTEKTQELNNSKFLNRIKNDGKKMRLSDAQYHEQTRQSILSSKSSAIIEQKKQQFINTVISRTLAHHQKGALLMRKEKILENRLGNKSGQQTYDHVIYDSNEKHLEQQPGDFYIAPTGPSMLSKPLAYPPGVKRNQSQDVLRSKQSDYSHPNNTIYNHNKPIIIQQLLRPRYSSRQQAQQVSQEQQTQSSVDETLTPYVSSPSNSSPQKKKFIVKITTPINSQGEQGAQQSNIEPQILAPLYYQPEIRPVKIKELQFQYPPTMFDSLGFSSNQASFSHIDNKRKDSLQKDTKQSSFQTTKEYFNRQSNIQSQRVMGYKSKRQTIESAFIEHAPLKFETLE